jgi:ribosome-binding protein aMBF1 (putative translation factor)
MARNPKIRSEALRDLYDRYIRDDPEREASLEQEMLNAEIAQKLYDLRTELGLAEEELAFRSGIDVHVISDLEEADYEGDALEVLKTIAAALGRRVEVRDICSDSQERIERDACSQSIGLAIL